MTATDCTRNMPGDQCPQSTYAAAIAALGTARSIMTQKLRRTWNQQPRRVAYVATRDQAVHWHPSCCYCRLFAVIENCRRTTLYLAFVAYRINVFDNFGYIISFSKLSVFVLLAVVRRPWSQQEWDVVMSKLACFMLSKTLPGKADIVPLLSQEECLKHRSRSWKNVKDFIHNIMSKKLPRFQHYTPSISCYIFSSACLHF